MPFTNGKKFIDVNIHASINLKSHRANLGLTGMLEVKYYYIGHKSHALIEKHMHSCGHPTNTYGLYHAHYGKNHSLYPKY